MRYICVFHYIKLLKKHHINIIFQVEKSVLTLLKYVSNDAEIIGPNDQIPDLDFHCPLLSLPLSFKTVSKSIPSNVPYLKADPTLIDHRASRLGVNIKKKIGLVWQDSLTHKNNQNRSINLSNLSQVLNDKAEFVSLHIELKDEECDFISKSDFISHHGSDTKNFNDTAALIHLMDLVITVATSVTHLAGAMGKPLGVIAL